MSGGKYYQWRGYLFNYCYKRGIFLVDYDEEILREYFAEGKTVVQAYKELLTELPKEKGKIFEWTCNENK